MKLDPLKQFARLKEQLTAERSEIEARLQEINEVLGTDTGAAQAPPLAAIPANAGRRRGRGPTPGNSMSMREAVLKALASGPVARKDLVKAVEGVGYRFNTKNPLNSIGSVLYAKNSPVKNKAGMFYVAAAPVPGSSSNGNGMRAEEQAPRRRKRRKMSAEGRARIAAAARARWARVKAGK